MSNEPIRCICGNEEIYPYAEDPDVYICEDCGAMFINGEWIE